MMLKSGPHFARFVALILSFMLVVSSANALSALKDEPHINASLIAAAIGDQIRKKCSTISPRYFTVIRSASNLEKYALGLGYSEDQIDAFMGSKVEKTRIRNAAQSYLDEHGAVTGDEASYCALGRSEITNETLTGKLLRAR